VLRTEKKRIATLLVAIVCLLLLGTLLALEGGEVAVLRTTGPDGAVRETRVWIADHDGAAWIEAANEERRFYRDILQHPQVELVRGGKVERFRAEPITTPDGHLAIRRLLAEKYGWADSWIGFIADTSSSIAVKLVRPALPDNSFSDQSATVMPAQAGIQTGCSSRCFWIPAFAGMTPLRRRPTAAR
jgi:hypothetical protein